MIKHNQDGAANGLVISLIFSVVLLVFTISFAGWAFASRQHYKDHSDQEASAASAIAVKKNSSEKDAAFAEAAKNPLKAYHGPEAYGSVDIKYPKTWSGYVNSSGDGDPLVDGYFAPGVVPSIDGKSSVFALRVQVVGDSYADVVTQLSSGQSDGKVTVAAYALPKLPKVTGVKVTGVLSTDQGNVTMVILPLRSETLKIWTEGDQYLKDFNDSILPNFTFSP